MTKRKSKQKRDADIRVADLRKSMIETGGPAFFRKLNEQANRNRPPKPTLPEGVPTDWIESMFCQDVCAIPLWSHDRWRFFLFCNGGQPVKDLRDDSLVGFDTYEEAITLGREWFAAKGKR